MAPHPGHMATQAKMDKAQHIETRAVKLSSNPHLFQDIKLDAS